MKALINPIAVTDCKVNFCGAEAEILDISFLRVIIQSTDVWLEFPENELLSIDIILNTERVYSTCKIVGKGNGWIRLHFEKMPISAQAKLRSFLSPQKIGESLICDWETYETKHFHGLNESELWFSNSGILLTYLDNKDTTSQFFIRVTDSNESFIVGRILRQDYIELTSIDSELEFTPLSNKALFCVLSECRDIVTNFRSSNQKEYTLKQRLFRIISEHLYSESKKISHIDVPTPRPITLFPNLLLEINA